jgi:hypothetical protein
VLLADLDGNDEDEVLLRYRSRFFLTPDILMCFSAASGKLLWQFTPDKTLRDSKERFSPNYHIRDLETISSPTTASHRWIAVAAIAAWGYPSIVSLLDESGKLLRSYVHSGHFEDLLVIDLDGDGDEEIVAGGQNESRGQATVVVLDPAKIGGASVEPPGSGKQILDLPPASGEIARMFFPRTPVSILRRDVSTALELYPDGNRVVAQVFEMRETSEDWAFLSYVIGPGMSVARVRADEFMMAAWDQARAKDPTVPRLDETELDRLGHQVVVVRPEAGLAGATSMNQTQ